jgi:hypothetical protein
MTIPLDDDAPATVALARIAARLAAGDIDEAEAYQRCLEAGCTPRMARLHVAYWTGQGTGS